MASTPPLHTVVHLPVRLDIAGHVAEAGTIPLDTGKPTWPQIADALRDLADALLDTANSPPGEDDEQEVSRNGTS
ncbi:hypothetical protein [Streptomyces sp. MBT53]|uniref:hypothetical protein n=1 Tax=Streptomyces sp. MBT53 TaxID=1488384 RepID=UPI001913A7EE|nr:hypothetical protein [Streptomyces sp. MBT53]MBK6018518.1 hypothetical protein [Streptomyces sp. MBT53]